LALSLLCPTALLLSTLTHHDHKPDHPLEEFRTRDFHAGVEHTEAANTVWCKKYGNKYWETSWRSERWRRVEKKPKSQHHRHCPEGGGQ
jgi:hypothetical protein